MKKFYSVSLLLLFVLLSKHSISQCDFKGIITDPNNPVNNELPIKKNTFFNWMNPTWPGNTTCYPGPGVDFTSPFYRIDNLEALRLLKDYKPQDGWELIRRDFGYTDNGTLITDRPEHTYLILYNKYRGILRVILRTCRKEDYNGAQINIRFQNPTFQTALLDLSNTAQALDAPHEVNIEFTAATTFYNDDSKYFYADYPLAYDPCTCTYQSRLQILSSLIETSTITLSGAITGNIVSITNKNGSVDNKDGSTSWKKITAGSEKLVQVHKTIDAFTTKSLEYANALDKIGMAQVFVSMGAELKKDNAFQAGLSALPWIGSAVSLLDLFIGGGKKSATPGPVELMPLSVNLNAKLDGTMITTAPYHSIGFPTPGSLNAQNDVDAYPYYNEVLGVFNLLNTPVMQTKKVTETYTSDDGSRYRLTYEYYRLKLSEIKYVLNPAAEVTIQDMKVAILAEGTGDPSGPGGGSFNVYEGKDAKTGNDVWSTEYVDAGCVEDYLHEINYGDEAGMNHWLPGKLHIKFILNLKRNNATATTQNILYVVKFPLNKLSIPNISYAPIPSDGINCPSSPVIAAQTTVQVQSLCSSTTYTANRYQSRGYTEDFIKEERLKVDVIIAPNPSDKNVVIKIPSSPNILERIVLVNAFGQTVKQIHNQKINLSVMNFQKDVSVSDLPNGIYYLTFYTNNTVQSTKVIIHHK